MMTFRTASTTTSGKMVASDNAIDQRRLMASTRQTSAATPNVICAENSQSVKNPTTVNGVSSGPCATILTASFQREIEGERSRTATSTKTIAGSTAKGTDRRMACQ